MLLYLGAAVTGLALDLWFRVNAVAAASMAWVMVCVALGRTLVDTATAFFLMQGAYLLVVILRASGL